MYCNPVEWKRLQNFDTPMSRALASQRTDHTNGFSQKTDPPDTDCSKSHALVEDSSDAISDGSDKPSSQQEQVYEFNKHDRAESIANKYRSIGYEHVTLHDVSLLNMKALVEELREDDHRRGLQTLLLNLCPGVDELDGYPGVALVDVLENSGLPYTGADHGFYLNTTFKVPMKRMLQKAGVSTAPFLKIHSDPGQLAADLDAAEPLIGYPMFLKPNMGYDSVGISLDSRMVDRNAAQAKISKGLGIDTSGTYLEPFLEGREYTVLIVDLPEEGNAEPPVSDTKSISNKYTDAGITYKAYIPVERVFLSQLPPHQRFLDFETYWNGFEAEDTSTNNLANLQPSDQSSPKQKKTAHDHFHCEPAPPELWPALMSLAIQAYRAVGGRSYGRVDIRTDETGRFKTKPGPNDPQSKSDNEKLFVLEVNSMPTLSCDQLSSSGSILAMASTIEGNDVFYEFYDGLVRAALFRHFAHGSKDKNSD